MNCCTDGEGCTRSSFCLIKMKEKLNLTKMQQFKEFCKLVYDGLHFSGPGVLEIMTLANQICCHVGNQEQA